MRASIPRILFSAPHSSSGKTLLSLLSLAWAKKLGLKSAAFKCGPDFIDPQYLSAVSSQPAHNLDAWMLDSQTNRGLFARHALGKDLAVIEGVMGLYDGKLGQPFGSASTASLAKLLKAPVVLVMPAAKAGQSLAATVLGLQKADGELNIAGVIFNQVSSARQAEMLAKAVEELCGLPNLGWLPKLEALALPERHLGLSAPSETQAWQEKLEQSLTEAEKTISFNALLEIAQRAEVLEIAEIRDKTPSPEPPVKIAVARDEAFHFYYAENLRLLEEAGAELLFFSPLHSARLPDGARGLLVGGGFPEMFGAALEANQSLREEVRRRVLAGLPTWAECGGLMWLAEVLVDLGGKSHRMVGALPAHTRMGKKLVNFGYLKAEARQENILLKNLQTASGHEFHHSQIEWLSQSAPGAWAVYQDGKPERAEGWQLPCGIATYVHLHLGSNPGIAINFLQACRQSNAVISH